MKVILLKDVPRLGRKLEVKEVPDGHALNFLVPRGLAERATPDAVRNLEKRMQNIEAERSRSEAEFAKLLAAVKDAEVTITAEANEQGHLFRGLHADDVAKALEAKGFTVRPDQILIERPLKETGTHEIKLVSGTAEGVCVVTITKA